MCVCVCVSPPELSQQLGALAGQSHASHLENLMMQQKDQEESSKETLRELTRHLDILQYAHTHTTVIRFHRANSINSIGYLCMKYIMNAYRFWLYL